MNTGNGGPTRLDDLFPSPVLSKRTDMANHSLSTANPRYSHAQTEPLTSQRQSGSWKSHDRFCNHMRGGLEKHFKMPHGFPTFQFTTANYWIGTRNQLELWGCMAALCCFYKLIMFTWHLFLVCIACSAKTTVCKTEWKSHVKLIIFILVQDKRQKS